MADPKVLVCCPTSDRKEYCQDEYIFRAKNLFYPNYEIFMADNSATKENYNKLINEYEIKANYINPRGRKIVEFLAESHEACRQYAIRNKFDYMLHLESDVFPAINVIERLMAHKKQVISGMYHVGIGHDSFVLLQDIEPYGDKRQTANIKDGELVLIDGHIKQMYHFGIGCTLIHKSVFEKIKFRNDYSMDIHADSWFANDLLTNNIPNYVDTSIICEHRNQPWTSEY